MKQSANTVRALRRTATGLAVVGVLATLTVLSGCAANTSGGSTTGSESAADYGAPVAPISAKTITGADVTIPAPNKATVLVFYSVGCGTCVEITKHVATIAANEPGAEYVAVNIDPTEDVRSATGFLDYIDSPALMGVNDTDGAIAREFQVASVSTIVVLNKSGQVVLRGVEPARSAITTAVQAAAA